MRKIAVFGGGATGHVVSAELGLRGFDVRLCEGPAYEESLAAAAHHMAIAISGPGLGGIGRLGMVTTDLAQALEGAELVIACTVSGTRKRPNFSPRT